MARYPSIVVAIYAALAVVVAQDQISSLPACAVSCLNSLDVVRLGCSTVDVKCQCSSQELVQEVSSCLLASCSASDLQAAQEYYQQICASAGEDVSLDISSRVGAVSTVLEEASSTVNEASSTADGGGVGQVPDETSTAETSTAERTPSGMTTSTRRAEEASNTSESETGTDTSTSSSSSTTDGNNNNNNNNGGGGGSSSNMPIGLGVGLGVGIPLTIGVIGFIYFLFWKTKRQDPKPATEADQGGVQPQVATTPYARKSELAGDAPPQRHELPGDAKYRHQEMP